MSTQKNYNAGEFKTHCLKIMDTVFQEQKEIVVSKRNQPMVRIVPFKEEKRELFGCLKETIESEEDLITPIEESWNASHR